MIGSEGDKGESSVIDFSSPYNLHPSDSPKQPSVNAVLTDGNYNDWVREMTNFIFTKNKTDFVDVTLEKPETSSSEYKSWMRDVITILDPQKKNIWPIKKRKTNKMTNELFFKTGHKREGCFKLVGYPDWWPGKKDDKAKPKAAYVETGTSPILGLNEGQYQEFVKFFCVRVITLKKNLRPTWQNMKRSPMCCNIFPQFFCHARALYEELDWIGCCNQKGLDHPSTGRNNAFLHGDLDEEVSMKILKGFAKEGETRVCRLQKSLYGLKQASRNCRMLSCRPSAFPFEQGTKLDNGEEEARVDATQYRRLVGRLLYLQATRPDVTYAVNVLSQFISDPRQSHLEVAKRVLRYLKGTPGHGILLPHEGPTTLTGYCDSDWLGCPFTRWSKKRYLLLFSASPISWKTKKQSVISRSSTEAKYRAMASTFSEIFG
nr:hypothetical protein [Tanacetum cinerariifolium]